VLLISLNSLRNDNFGEGLGCRAFCELRRGGDSPSVLATQGDYTLGALIERPRPGQLFSSGGLIHRSVGQLDEPPSIAQKLSDRTRRPPACRHCTRYGEGRGKDPRQDSKIAARTWAVIRRGRVTH
jgi:hypothetical protein